jgi:hypothetical protein
MATIDLELLLQQSPSQAVAFSRYGVIETASRVAYVR